MTIGRAVILTGLLLLGLAHSSGPALASDQPITLRAKIGNDEIVLVGEPRFAGAISQLWFRGKQYINSADHGRLISTAVSFDGWGECLNPTEGGSVEDGAKHTSTSVLRRAQVSGDVWQTETQMAYWMSPGKPHKVNPFDQQVHSTPQPCTTDPARASINTARNSTALSNVMMHKRIQIGALGLANVLEFDIVFSVPEPHEKAIFEALTPYLEPEFNRYSLFDRAKRVLNGVSYRGSGPEPVVIATSDGKHAVGIADNGPPYPQFGRTPGAILDGEPFYAFNAPAVDRLAIYACHLGYTDDTFLSQQNDCEGASVDSAPKLLGYILRQKNEARITTEPLFRCLDKKRQVHLSTTNRAQCDAVNAAVEGIEGVAPRP